MGLRSIFQPNLKIPEVIIQHFCLHLPIIIDKGQSGFSFKDIFNFWCRKKKRFSGNFTKNRNLKLCQAITLKLPTKVQLEENGEKFSNWKICILHLVVPIKKLRWNMDLWRAPRKNISLKPYKFEDWKIFVALVLNSIWHLQPAQSD